MTETRQITDTEFRIDTLIRREADPQDETTESGIMRAAQTIAAEIDALTAERDAARAQVIEARAMASEREDFRLKQIADIRQERDEARDKLIEVRNTLHHANNEFAVILRERDDSTDFVQELREAEQATLANTQRLLGVAHAELAEARAEVERLRLPAEAWRTLEAYREAERNGTSEEAEGARRVHIPIRDAARARAAKESL